MRFTELAAVTGGELLTKDKADRLFTGVSIDSRGIKEGEVFIALRGEVHDGHTYIDQALAKGAAGIVTEVSFTSPLSDRTDAAVVKVKNSHEAMLKLARKYRDTIKGRFIGITGSNGKTTTKELTYRLIKAVEPATYCSPGNLNNLYGVPLALFAVPTDAATVVIEMGISTEVEMPTLADMVRPDLIIITNIGPSHLEFLGTIEAVARAKLELVRRADASVPVIINADDELLVKETKKVRGDFITFALDNEADFKPEAMESGDDATRVSIDGHEFGLPLVGRHQVYNLLAAYAAFKTMGYSFEKIDTSSLSLGTAPMRGQTLILSGVRFIADCYNSNPESLRAGLEAFSQIKTEGRRIIILGDMLELGEESENYHRQAGRQLASLKFDKAVVVGEQSWFIRDEAVKSGCKEKTIEAFENAEKAAEAMKGILKQGDLVYIKGSRGVGLEAVMNVFERTEESR